MRRYVLVYFGQAGGGLRRSLGGGVKHQISASKSSVAAALYAHLRFGTTKAGDGADSVRKVAIETGAVVGVSMLGRFKSREQCRRSESQACKRAALLVGIPIV